ncbi:MAG: hypothetical protein GY725_03870, partial [bacterium]|nr:hypothetical protein [bacterium]
HHAHVPTIDGFQCPTVVQDPEQNALLKAILFTPWSCTNAVDCGSVMNFRHLLSNGCGPEDVAGDAAQLAELAGDASRLAASSSSSSSKLGRASGIITVSPRVPQRAYTFHRAWRLRHSEIHVLAGRADCRCAAARKRLVLADTTVFAENKEPRAEIQHGEATKDMLRNFCSHRLQRTMAAQATRLILSFLGLPCKWHDEQCTLAEFAAYLARDVIAHIDLAAEARVKKPTRPLQDAESEYDSDSDDGEHRTRPAMEFVDMGGGDGDEQDVDVPPCELSNFPLHEVTRTLSLCLQQEDIASLPFKTRKSQADLNLMRLNDAYGTLLQQNFAFDPASTAPLVRGFGQPHTDMIALQKKTIALAKKQQTGGEENLDDADANGSMWPSSASQQAEPQLVPLPLAIQGPAVVARKLLEDDDCTEEQTDAVALLALSLQKR